MRQILQNEPGQWALFFVLVQKVKRLLHSQYRKSRSPAHTQASSMQAPGRDQRIEYRASANYMWQLIPAVGMQVDDPRKKMNDQTTHREKRLQYMFQLVKHGSMRMFLTIDALYHSLALLKRPRKKSPKAKVKQWLLSAKPCKAFAQFGQLGKPSDARELEHLPSGNLTVCY